MQRIGIPISKHDKEKGMKTTAQIERIKAAVLYILERFPKGADYITLFKVMYFAQQAHLVRYGKPLVEESFRAVKHGPVPTYTYKALQIADGKPLEGDFTEFLNGLEVKEKRVYAKADPDMDFLSGAGRRCLDAAIEKCRGAEPFDLSDLSHDMAWEEAMARMKDDPQKNFITHIDMARAGGVSEEMVEYMREKQMLKDALAY